MKPIAEAMTAMNVDFLADWRAILTDRLQSMGYTIDAGDDGDTVAIKYFNVMRALVAARPRKVVESDTFTLDKLSAVVQAGYAALKTKFACGKDVQPHQSLEWHKRADFFDGLLHDWDIHHFHLGTTPHHKHPALVERTAPLLYAMVANDTVYCITIDEHGKWTELELLRTINRNWSQLLDRFRPKGILDVEGPPITEDGMRLRRQNGIISLIKVEPGFILFSPGGGYMSDGSSAVAVRTMLQYKVALRDLETLVRAKEAVILAQRVTGASATPLSLKLRIDNGWFVAVDEHTGQRYKLGMRFPV